MHMHLEAHGNPQSNKTLCCFAVPESLPACPRRESEIGKSNSRLVCKIAEKKGEKIYTHKNGCSAMPERQTTDGQTELESKCQGLEQAVDALGSVLRGETAKRSHVANVSDSCKGRGQGGTTFCRSTCT